MGIPNLLSFVQGASREAHVSEYSGRTLAVDASVWLLHRAADSVCGRERD